MRRCAFGGTSSETLNGHVLGTASAGTFAFVFLGLAGTMIVAFVAGFLLEEKPLQETHPE
ncbi:MAG TPA: hypothetical protein VH206_07650 [Xanthobacteraceae bacterium]|jgi:hypothetical protein|nr:hypothetical protein [Xanthobacteraceae bacterium]